MGFLSFSGDVNGLQPDDNILIVCNSGNMSTKSILSLKAQGFKQAKHVHVEYPEEIINSLSDSSVNFCVFGRAKIINIQ